MDIDFVARCNQFKEGLINIYESFNKEMEDIYDRESIIFDAFHADKDENDDTYRVRKEVASVYWDTDEDKIYTKDKFLNLEDQVMEIFKNLENFACEAQWERYAGVQFNFTHNEKLYLYLHELSSKGNIYVTDYILFDLLQMGQFVDKKYLVEAKAFYEKIDDPQALPLNYIYRAVLYDDIEGFLNHMELVNYNNVFDKLYEWNISPVKTVLSLKDREVNFKGDEINQIMMWLVSKTLHYNK